MLEIRTLSGGYGDKTVVRGLSMTAPAGQITAVLGPNGCGKSTLLKLLCGILRPSSGQVLLSGEDLRQLPQNLLARKVSYLAQDKPVPDISVQRMVLHGRFPYLSYPRRYRREDYEVVESVLRQVGIAHLADSAMSCLSGGQRQQVYIAMALAQETPVVLLDEPTTFLDIRHQLHMMRQARALAEQGKSVLMVIHDLPHAMQTADQLVLMDQGQVAACGSPDEVYASGRLEEVFRVKMNRVSTGTGWQYFCEELI